ncbi:MAG: insulinase family protein [Gemmatimonadaceae bacterium]|nr:insulinase family protein [Acetobacteraceae bacterium]
MNIEQTVLPSGLRVVSVNLPGFDSAAVAAFVKAGARNETESNNGIAHFLEHMAFKGTTTRSALQIASEIEVLGSNINAFTSHEMTCYFVTGLKSTIGQSVAIIGNVLTASTYNSPDIETEKGVILQEIRRSADNPSHVAYDGYGLTAYPGQSIGRPILGRAELIETVGRDHFTSFVADHYFAQNMVVVGTGDFSHETFVDHVATHFDKLPSRNAEVTITPANYAGGHIRNTEKDFEQVTILLGLQSVPETDPSVWAHKVAARALGGGMSSPLFQEVREKRGLVYSVSAYSDHGVDHGEMVMFAGTTAKHVDELLDVACGEMTKLTARVSDADMTRAKNSVLVALATAKERPFSLARGIAGSLFEHGRIITPEDSMRKVEAVTTDDVTAAMRMMIATNPTISLVGPVPDQAYHSQVRAALA